MTSNEASAKIQLHFEEEEKMLVAAEVLEAVMLICFGFSWPINAVKNYKAKTAKSMSLPFMSLTLTGYFVGIAAKFVKIADTGEFTYVLIAYFINVISVSINIALYFVNRRHDKAREKEHLQETEKAA